MRRPFYFEIFWASLAAILLEIAYTRIFLFKVHYSFTYLVIGIGLMGLGAGGALVAAWARLANADRERAVPLACLLGAVTVLIGYVVVASVQLNASALDTDPGEIVKLVAVCGLLGLPFTAVGAVVSLILSASDHPGRPYAADLAGAGLGCLAATLLLGVLDPPRVIMLAGSFLALAAAPRIRTRRVELAACGVLGSALLVAGIVPGWLPDPVVDRQKGFEAFRERGAIRDTRWNPVFRVDVAEPEDGSADTYLLFHDGAPGSALRRFPSRAFAHLETSSRKLPFTIMPRLGPRVLIIGAAGGHEVVASLYFGASHVTAVELNPAMLDLVTRTYGDFTGRLKADPRVRFVNGDGRWFLEQTRETFDLIWIVAPDSFTAVNASTSGALVPVESYLYTVEMADRAFRRLAPDGILCAQFGEPDYERKPNRTTRFLASAKFAFYDLGIPDFKRRVMVATAGAAPFTESTLVLSPAEITQRQIDSFRLHTELRIPGGVVRYVHDRLYDETPVNLVIATPQDVVADWYALQPYLVDPVRDDAPFFWHFTSFMDALGLGQGARERLVDYEDGIGERVLIVVLGVAIVLGAIFLCVPVFAMRRVWNQIAYKGSTAAYFAALGVGFMFVEVPLIQRLTLLLGYPTRSLSVTLFGLLLSTGIGSWLSSRYAPSSRRALGPLLAILFVLLSFWHLAAPRAVHAFLGSAVAVRAAVAVALIAPVGICLGGFLPIGLNVIAGASSHRRQLVAWAWAVNACASVVGSILAVILAMTTSFKFLLAVAPLIYAAGALALMRIEPEATATERAGARGSDAVDAGAGSAPAADPSPVPTLVPASTSAAGAGPSPDLASDPDAPDE